MPFSFHLRRLRIAAGCDRRGSGTLYEHKIAITIEFDYTNTVRQYDTDQRMSVLHNNEDLPGMSKEDIYIFLIKNLISIIIIIRFKRS